MYTFTYLITTLMYSHSTRSYRYMTDFICNIEMVKRLVATGASTQKLLSQWEDLQQLVRWVG